MSHELRGGFPLVLGSGDNQFIVDWSLKNRKAISPGMYPSEFEIYWVNTYPKWADELPVVMYRLKNKGLNLAGPFVKEDVIEKNKMGQDRRPLTQLELTTLLAPMHPPSGGNPWEGITTKAPDLCCGDTDPLLG